ncbi:MAG: hypothetical protein HY690_08770 [Chloroflexi bacterium]|nr:hypothetical protein [Chloroflexota bacterium]
MADRLAIGQDRSEANRERAAHLAHGLNDRLVAQQVLRRRTKLLALDRTRGRGEGAPGYNSQGSAAEAEQPGR